MFEYLKNINLVNKKFKFHYLFFLLTTIVATFKFNLAYAASDAPLFSLANTDFVVAI